MKSKRFIAVIILFLVTNLLVLKVFALESVVGENMSPVINGSILCFENVQGTADFYIGTEEGMYWTSNAGVKWQKIFLPPGVFQVQDIVVTNKYVFILCKKGIYKSDKFELNWKRLSRIKDIAGITFFNKDENEWGLLAWSHKCFYKIDENGQKKVGPRFLKGDIKNVLVDGGSLFWVCAGSVFIMDIENNKWDEIRLFSRKNFSEEDNDSFENEFSELNEMDVMETSIKDISLFENDSLVILDVKGIHVLGHSGRLKEDLSIAGLPLHGLKRLVCEGRYVFVASDDEVFLYNFETKSWKLIFEKSLPGKISFFDIQKDTIKGMFLWVAVDKNLYKEFIRFENLLFIPDNLEKKRQLEALYTPSIKDVQKMAIDYAEVSNDKIKQWRDSVRWKAVLPKFSIGFSESIGDNVEIYKSATTAYVVNGPKEKDNDWDCSLSWDFSDLIWNDAQTSIDVRSKLMVQLREDILEEVTRLYFERIKLLLYIQEMEKDMNQIHGRGMQDFLKNLQKLHEATAYIDALTGGKFSEAVKTDFRVIEKA
ncbi:MAG: hypothetical protein ABIH85_05265 [Candidatus Omnitrophota bacterium]